MDEELRLREAFRAGWWVNAATPGESGAGCQEYFDRCEEVDWQAFVAENKRDAPPTHTVYTPDVDMVAIARDLRALSKSLARGDTPERQSDPRNSFAYQVEGDANRLADMIDSLAHRTPLATQPTAAVGEGEAMRAEIIRQIERDRLRFNEGSMTWNAYGFCIAIADAATLHTPPTVATATVVDEPFTARELVAAMLLEHDAGGITLRTLGDARRLLATPSNND